MSRGQIPFAPDLTVNGLAFPKRRIKGQDRSIAATGPRILLLSTLLQPWSDRWVITTACEGARLTPVEVKSCFCGCLGGKVRECLGGGGNRPFSRV